MAMLKDIEGSTVAVTGGASGIGLAIADAFLQRGARRLILLDLNPQQADKATNTLNAKHGNKATFIQCDVTKDLDQVTKVIIDTYKTVDVLVNSAGIVDERNPRKVIDINLTALVEWSLKFFDIMRTDRGGKGGTIINISSMYGFMVDPYLPTYKATKYGVLGFTKSKGHEYHFNKTGVRLLAICPGVTKTNLLVGYQTYEEKENQEDFVATFESFPWAEVARVGQSVAEVFGTASSGTAWVIEGDKPVYEA
ncbi:15-hydroxyprostaglandin dehydrogenase [NAD(+)]-like [Leguminivora glycinivorella]|uniref:15-hydroxyprostaglandin dehydrogenase [NAD(+)]-like n=1 Tax=Leguminivora glycinivorella TaxID=1035111 RepID=UPI0020108F34|nr:15-hydroxyprostaglandin dehydrogenase [NAD(+)]-like [Leguminivora glycinivorella]